MTVGPIVWARCPLNRWITRGAKSEHLRESRPPARYGQVSNCNRVFACVRWPADDRVIKAALRLAVDVGMLSRLSGHDHCPDFAILLEEKNPVGLGLAKRR